jgi:hypothetical protein
MKWLAGFFRLVMQLLGTSILALLCTFTVFCVYKASQPMAIPEAPEGMTYIQFMEDRIDAAKTIEPPQCGWGMIITLTALGSVYSVVYTDVGIHPGGLFDHISAPDSNIPTGVAGAEWHEVPDIWWRVVERLSWTMLGKQHPFGCQFRPVEMVKE